MVSWLSLWVENLDKLLCCILIPRLLSNGAQEWGSELHTNPLSTKFPCKLLVTCNSSYSFVSLYFSVGFFFSYLTSWRNGVVVKRWSHHWKCHFQSNVFTEMLSVKYEPEMLWKEYKLVSIPFDAQNLIMDCLHSLPCVRGLLYGREFEVWVSGYLWSIFCLQHSGIFHIALGCWMLLTFGPRVCRAYGSFTFFLLYILGGISGNLTSFLHIPDPTVGGTVSSIHYFLYILKMLPIPTYLCY